MEHLNSDEFEAAQEAANDSTGKYIHRFYRPLLYNGKELDELSFDWDSLTGDDALSIENEMQTLGKPVIVPAFSGEYLIRMAVRACTTKIGADAFHSMALTDYNKIRSAARSFLLKSEQ